MINVLGFFFYRFFIERDTPVDDGFFKKYFHQGTTSKLISFRLQHPNKKSPAVKMHLMCATIAKLHTFMFELSNNDCL